VLREDFSGTSLVSIEWLKTDPQRRAWAVDLDPEVFEWCRTQHLPKLADAVKERLELVGEDVLHIPAASIIPPADVVCANNFSWQCFKDEALLARYFQIAYDGLNAGGIFVLDIFGGQDTLCESSELISDHGLYLVSASHTVHDGFLFGTWYAGCSRNALERILA
jgi:spermidine synthase